ncbi:MAG TPA: hypothetical protein VHV74_08115 [Pseudonocardiaceae bacterium]|jgi:hypothetical protein|nr:hypothetical protein [Pseudonocardiaceae bacterium]
MRWTVRGRGLLVAGVGVAAIALAGCSPTSISGSAAPQGATGHSGQGQQQETTAASVSELGAQVQHTTTVHNTVHMDMTMTVPEAGSISATGDMKFGSSVAEQMTMNLPSVGSMRMVLVDGTIYLKLPSSLTQELGSDKPWAKISLNGDDPLSQSLGSTTDLAGQADPSQLLKQIASAGTITKVSHETLNGQPVTHYAITVDVAKMAQTMTGNAQEKQALSQLGISTMPFDIWVDSNNLPMKIVTKVAYDNPVSGGSEAVSIQVNYSNWGQPVTISAPPSSEVGELGGH